MLKINPTSGETEEISIFDLMDGAVKERAALVLRNILDNIADLNTDHKKVRTLTVKFLFAPSEDRTAVNVDVQCEGKTAPIKGIATNLLLGQQNGEPIAVEQPKSIPGQIDLSGGEQEPAKVVTMGAKRA